MNRFDVAIIGGGPGGLSCAEILAEKGARVILLERKTLVGRKVCAGGITWHGMIRQLPDQLLQRTFPRQYIFSNWQRMCLCNKDPIIATVNREELGRWMMEKAAKKGAHIRIGCNVRNIDGRNLTAVDKNGKTITLHYDHLVGADGSSSLVRRHLGIPIEKLGIGINCQIPAEHTQMEWHLNTGLFGSGYGWIFPHRETVSIGAYAVRGAVRADRLKAGLITWARSRGFDLTSTLTRAELINFDYRGLQFGRNWLVGDAAGLASGLTGEGINPAIASGQHVAHKIINPAGGMGTMTQMINKHKRHEQIVSLASRSRPLCTLLMETLVLLLRLNIIDFQKELSL